MPSNEESRECDNARELISAELDGEALPGQMAGVRDHLSHCAACAAWRDDVAATHRALRVQPALAVPDLTETILTQHRATQTTTFTPVAGSAPSSRPSPPTAAAPFTSHTRSTTAPGAASPAPLPARAPAHRRRSGRRHALAAAAAAVLLTGLGVGIVNALSGQETPAPQVAIADATVSGGSAGNSALAFVSITNTGGGDRLLAARSSAAAQTRLHSYDAHDGLVVMAEQAGYAVPPRSTVVFEPGGAHLMLEGLHSDLSAGDEVELTLVFERAGPQPARAVVGETTGR